MQSFIDVAFFILFCITFSRVHVHVPITPVRQNMLYRACSNNSILKTYRNSKYICDHIISPRNQHVIRQGDTSL